MVVVVGWNDGDGCGSGGGGWKGIFRGEAFDSPEYYDVVVAGSGKNAVAVE